MVVVARVTQWAAGGLARAPSILDARSFVSCFYNPCAPCRDTLAHAAANPGPKASQVPIGLFQAALELQGITKDDGACARACVCGGGMGGGGGCARGQQASPCC